MDNVKYDEKFEKMLRDFMKDSKKKQREVKEYHETGHEKKVKAERERKQRQKYNKRRK